MIRAGNTVEQASRAVLDELARRVPGKKLAVIGFCFGGGLTWQLLAAGEPRIAVAVVLEGEEDQNFGGGLYSGPVVKAILQAWKDKRERPPAAPPVNFKME